MQHREERFSPPCGRDKCRELSDETIQSFLDQSQQAGGRHRAAPFELMNQRAVNKLVVEQILGVTGETVFIN